MEEVIGEVIEETKTNETKQELVTTKDNGSVALRTSEGLVAVAQKYLNSNGNIVLPPNYDVNAAVKSLYLQTLQTVDKQKKPALEVCTRTSIEQVVQEYVSKGLNIEKKQCYLVVYGNALTLQEGYFGKQKQAKTDAHIKINSNVIYEGEKVTIENRLDGSKIIHHESDFTKFNVEKIVGAYAVAIREDGSVDDSDIMTMQEIKRSWGQSRSGGDVSKQFPVEMCRKTVISRLAKKYINTSDDSAKFDNLETDVADYYKNDDINADIVIEDNVEIKPAPVQTKTTNKEVKMDLDNLDSASTKEISYTEYINNKDNYTIVPNSYNKQKKTIMVYC